MKAFTKRWLVLCVTVAFVISSLGCGTLLYPERLEHPRSDNLDAKVVVMDCAWFLLCIWPGAVALGVDFVNETIYLPEMDIETETEDTEEVAITLNGVAPTGLVLMVRRSNEQRQTAVTPISPNAFKKISGPRILCLVPPQENNAPALCLQ